jgi:hypothetical protein
MSSPKKKFTVKKKKETITECTEIKIVETPMELYIKSLDEKEQQAIKIAQDHLKSSFHIEKSNGYSNYLKN